MPVGPNHSANLPREFTVCPNCNKKGFFRHGGTIVRTSTGWGGTPPGRRCKYCKHGQPDMPSAEYENHLTDTFTRGPAKPASMFNPSRRPNGAIIGLTVIVVDGAVDLDRTHLLELTKLLATDPSLCRLPEAKFRRVQ